VHPCTRSRRAAHRDPPAAVRFCSCRTVEPRRGFSRPMLSARQIKKPPTGRLLNLSGGERGIQLSPTQPIEPRGIHKPEVCPVLCLEHCRAIQVCADSSRAPPCAIRECCSDRRGLAADGSIRWTRLLNEPSQGLLAANHFIANNGHLARGEDLLLVTGGDHASSALAAPGTTHKCRPSSQFAIGDMKNAVGRRNPSRLPIHTAAVDQGSGRSPHMGRPCSRCLQPSATVRPYILISDAY